MKAYSRVVMYLLAVTFFAASAAWCSVQAQDDIGACVTQSDGSTITLICEQVMWRGKSGKSFAIKEWSEKWPERPRLLVVSTQRLPVEAYWSVDITGILSTLTETTPDGSQIAQRVLIVSPSNVQVYCFRDGRPAPCAVFKGMPSMVYTKISLTELSQLFPSSMMSTMSEELPPLPDTPDSPPPALGSRNSLKWLPDGANVALNGIVVTGFNNDGFFVERSDRSFGIKVVPSYSVGVGRLVDICGRMATVGGERVIEADSSGVVILDENTAYPLPYEVGLNNRSVGGGAIGPYTPAVADSTGLNNTGMLLRNWGNVTFERYDPNGSVYYIDDGSAVTAGIDPYYQIACTGIKVYDPSYDLPGIGTFVAVSGIAGAEIPQGGASSIRTLWKTDPVVRSTQSGTGTISGTITAQGANGKTVRVYSRNASITKTFNGDTVNYTLSVPYDSHAVTASLLGYKTTTKLATVNAVTPNVTLDFILPEIQRRMSYTQKVCKLLS